MGLRDLLDLNTPPAGEIAVPNVDGARLPGIALGPLNRGRRRRDVALAGSSLIQTPEGPRAAQDLDVGDLVDTLDHGPRPLLWVGRSAPAYQLTDDISGPIRIRARALGDIGPKAPLTVLADQRILIDCPQCEALLGYRQFFVAARHLLHLRGVRRIGDSDTPAVHLMLDTSAVIRANGAWVEAWRPDQLSVKTLPEALREDLRASDASIMHAARMARYQAAHPNLNAQEARRLIR